MPEVILFFVLFVTPLAFTIFYFAFSKNRHSQEMWQKVAKEFQLQCSEGSGMGALISGRLRKRATEARVYFSGQKQSVPHVDVTVDLNSNINIDISREGVASLAERLTGSKELKLGYGPFDSKFYVHTSDSAALKKAFSPALLDACVRAKPTSITAENGVLKVHYSGYRLNLRFGGWRRLGDDCSNGIRIAVGLAEKLENIDAEKTPFARVGTVRPVNMRHVFMLLLYIITAILLGLAFFAPEA